MDRGRRFVWGLVVMLLAPVVALAGFAVYVHVANARRQSGLLQTNVSPQVVWPWGESTYYLAFGGDRGVAIPVATPTPAPPPPPVDMAFMVDESGSMIPTLKAMSDAAHTVTRELSKEQPGRLRFALIRFDTTAEIVTDWTADPEELRRGLQQVYDAPKSGGNDFREASVKLNELISRSRPGARRVVIFYTDGFIAACGGCIPMPEDEIRAWAEKLRRDRQVEMYSVGIPDRGTNPLMFDVTGDRSRVYDPRRAEDLAGIFSREVRGRIEAPANPELPAGGGQLSHRLDGRHFSAPIEGTSWAFDGGSGILSLTVEKTPESETTYAHPLVPLSAGVWRVGVEPPRMSYVDKAGKLQTVVAERRPLLLKVTYFTLLLMLLPALLWALAHIRRRKRPVAVERREAPPLPDIPRPSLPTPLPVLPRVVDERLPVIPTLFIGLGGAGRRALAAVRAELKQAHLGRAGEPYRFLWIDLDTNEAERETPFEDWAAYQMESLIAPPDVRQVQSYLPSPGAVPDHLQWFNPREYGSAPRNQLVLADGAKGDRALARLALFHWLPRRLLPALAEQMEQLAALPSSDETRQIVVFACSDGGVGSGWFLDFGRLLGRLARDESRGDAKFYVSAPEIVGVLCDDPNRRHPENRRALMMEVESAMAGGALPQRVTYLPDVETQDVASLLNQVDAQSPYHWVFSAKASDKDSVAANCADLAATLVERHPRAALLDQARQTPARGPVVATSSGAHVMPTLVYDQARCDLFLRLLGPDILLDVTPDAQGGLKLKAVAEASAREHLDDWSRAEPAGNPLQLLLAAAANPISVAGFMNWAQSALAAPREWFGEAFATSLTRRLQGRGEPGGAGWERDWMPGEAIATLRSLADRLEQNVKPELQRRGGAAPALELADHVARLAASAADGLDQWARDLCQVCERVVAERSALERTRGRLVRLQGRVYLDRETGPDQVERWARAGLEHWLDTPDTIPAIRQRLFFSVSADSATANVAIHSFIEEQRTFAHAGELADAIGQLARTLALLVPSVRIGGALAHLSEESRRAAARELARTPGSARQTLIIAPRTGGAGAVEQRAIEDFKALIPKPAGQGRRGEQSGDDHSAIRRLEFEPVADIPAPAGVRIPFIELAERAAEAVRQRAEAKSRIAVPVFPPPLRLALAHEEAFRSFARAYQAGRIARRQDQTGQEQWVFLDTGEFLTFDDDRSLASAAANYVSKVNPPPATFPPASGGGDFRQLERWRAERHMPDDDTLALMAIDVYL